MRRIDIDIIYIEKKKKKKKKKKGGEEKKKKFQAPFFPGPAGGRGGPPSAPFWPGTGKRGFRRAGAAGGRPSVPRARAAELEERVAKLRASLEG